MQSEATASPRTVEQQALASADSKSIQHQAGSELMQAHFEGMKDLSLRSELNVKKYLK